MMAMAACGTVLVLEDDDDIRCVLRLVLTGDGHDVEVCASPEQVIERAAATSGALAVVDFESATPRTLATGERAALARLAHAIPTILVTARAWAGEHVAREVGLLAVVRKPFDVDELCAVVSDALDGEDCDASVTPGR